MHDPHCMFTLLITASTGGNGVAGAFAAAVAGTAFLDFCGFGFAFGTFFVAGADDEAPFTIAGVGEAPGGGGR